MRTRFRALIAALLIVFPGGAAYALVYYEVCPGQQVLTENLGGWTVGPVSSPQIVGEVISFNSSSADLLHISVSTTSPSVLYLLNGAQMTEYYMDANANIYDLPLMLNTTVPGTSSWSPPSYPPTFLYSSQSAESHSEYLAVQKQTSYYLVELSLPNATSLAITAGAIQGYSART